MKIGSLSGNRCVNLAEIGAIPCKNGLDPVHNETIPEENHHKQALIGVVLQQE